MKIRRYPGGDRDQVIRLWQTVFADVPSYAKPRKVLDARLAVDDLLFAAECRRIKFGMDMGGYDGHSGWLYSVAVDHRKRRSGIGKNLIEYTMQVLQELGCRKVELQVDSKNEQALPFYQEIDFLIEDRISMSMLIN